MKTVITSLLLTISLVNFSQSKEFVIVDNISKKPIDLAQIFYSNLEIRSISNEDGKIKIPLKKHKIIVSHINYIEKEFYFNDFKQKDTLFLIPKTNQLNEVVLYNIDLKQKFIDILENSYLKKYRTKKVIHNSTYKEIFNVNDSLTRLFQIQLDWYSKNSLYKTDPTIDKQNIINIESIDYSKISKISNNDINVNAGYVENESFFQYLHLNYLLYILVNFTEEYEIKSVQKNGKSNNVYFNATLLQNGKKLYKHQNSLIVFDNDYKSIKHLAFNMDYMSGFEEFLSKKYKNPYEKKIENHTIELSFKKLKDNKYSISYFTSEVKGIIKNLLIALVVNKVYLFLKVI